VIALKDIHKRFGDNQVLSGIDLNIRDGEVVAVIGVLIRLR
jgi:ABC-type histidine transport system ATPase subunit